MWASVFIGIVTGLIASFLIWFAFMHIVKPKIRLSTFISKAPSLVKGTPLYRIKIENESRFRAYDLYLNGRLRVYGLDKQHPDKPVGFVTLVGAGNHPYLESRKENCKLCITGRELLVRPTKETRKNIASLWNTSTSNVNIESILSCDDRNTLEVSLIATHSFSGARRLFTMRYNASSIRGQLFTPKGVYGCMINEHKHTSGIFEDDEATDDAQD